MNPPDDIQVLVNARLQQAEDSLREGQLLLQNEFHKGAINRFYYAMFYAVLALLITRQLGTSKHSGAIALFDREFVKPGIFSKEMSLWLHSAFELRLEADYAELVEVSAETAHESAQQALIFVKQITDYLLTDA